MGSQQEREGQLDAAMVVVCYDWTGRVPVIYFQNSVSERRKIAHTSWVCAPWPAKVPLTERKTDGMSQLILVLMTSSERCRRRSRYSCPK